jgi:hypothetical protein
VKCTLQVIEFMAAHSRYPVGDYSYHHCADLQIRANPKKPIDTRFPVENKPPENKPRLHARGAACRPAANASVR